MRIFTKLMASIFFSMLLFSPLADATPSLPVNMSNILTDGLTNTLANGAKWLACGGGFYENNGQCTKQKSIVNSLEAQETAEHVAANQPIFSASASAMDFNDLASFTQTIENSGLTMASRFNNGQLGYANVLLDILGGIAFTWLGLMIMLSQADVWHMGLRPMFMLAITFGMAKWFLSDYNTLVSQVIGGFTYAGSILAGAKSSSIWSIGGLFLNQVMQIYTALGNAMTSTFASHDPIRILTHEANDFFLGIIVVAITVILAAAALIFLVTYIVYYIAVAIAFAVGPVFIPFMVLPVTKFLFEGWLKFLITTGLYLMSAWVLVGLLSTGFLQFADKIQIVSSSQTANSGLIAMGPLLELIAFAIACAYSMLKIPEYAHAMAGSLSLGGLNAASAAASVATKGKIK
jgi:hypothetical protein